MTWSDNDRQQFVAYLIDLGSINRAAMMEAIYQALISDHERIFSTATDKQKVEDALNQVIAWFAEKEKYEYCHKINEIKRCLKSK